MEVAFEYTKKRSEFGKHCQFTDGETTVLESILPTDAFDESYISRTTMVTAVDTTPFMTESSINTERVVYASTSMQHREGAWPKDVDPTEQSDVKRFRKRVEKDAQFDYAMKMLVPKVEKCLMQNNTVNIYESYFAKEETNHYSEPPFAMGLAVFRDPSPVTRSATSVNW
jgi:dynein intermediate chain 2